MNLKRLIILIAIFLCAEISSAQNEIDALNLSREEVTGSARTIAMGGAFTALGGDFSAIEINPAGLGVLRSNEFTITPAFHTNISNSTYYGQETLDSKSNFNLGSVGIVGVKNLNKVGKWRSSAIAFGMNRSMSFHQAYTFRSSDVPSSLVDSYENTLIKNGLGPEDLDVVNAPYGFDIFLAWQNFLLDYPFDDDTTSVFYNATGEMPIDQTYRVEKSGSKRETFLAFGGNYDDKLYIGGNIRFSRINYDNTYIINESIDPSDTTTNLNEHSFRFDENISGLGVGLNLGLIYRPTNQLRLGASLKTPTIYSLNIEYESENTAIFEDFDPYYSQSLLGDYDFRLTSPLQTSFGVAYVFGKLGLVSADVEYVNYTGMRMQGTSDGYNFNAEEDAIQAFLTPTVNLKFGAEYRVSDFVSLRAGYAKFGDPYNSNADNFGGFDLYSFGIGYRTEDFFVDGSYQLKNSQNTEYIYDPNLVESGTSEFTDHRISITFGYKF